MGKIYSLDLFVETGTYLGGTTEAAAKHFERCMTIELDPALARNARDRLKHLRNVEVHEGSSDDVLARILPTIDVPALFWLDAHYSGGITVRGRKDSPIIKELRLILEHPVRGHLILIDDARDFLGVFGYPTINWLKKYVRGLGFSIRISNDIIRIFEEDI